MLSQTSLDYSIEQLQQKPTQWEQIKKRYQGANEYCRKNLLINKTKKEVKRSNCGMFSCEHCRPHKIMTTVRNIRALSYKHALTRFLTMTVKGKEFRSIISVNESYPYLEQKFRELKILYKREFGKDLKYIRLARAQKTGYCHFHILINRYIPKKWLNQIMERIGAGYCNIKYVDPQRTSAYLSAYLERKEHEWYLPKGIRHYTMSKGLSFEKYEPKDTWVFIYTGRKSNNIILIWRMIHWEGCYDILGSPKLELFDYGYGIPPPNEVEIIKNMLRCA